MYPVAHTVHDPFVSNAHPVAQLQDVVEVGALEATGCVPCVPQKVEVQFGPAYPGAHNEQFAPVHPAAHEQVPLLTLVPLPLITP